MSSIISFFLSRWNHATSASFQIAFPVLVPITVIYLIMFLTGVVGNVAVCLVIIRNRSMHTATNYYLSSLAISDLVILMLGREGGFVPQ